METGSSSSSRPVWWKQYFVPFFTQRNRLQRSVSSRSVAAIAVPLSVFTLVSFGGNYALLSNTRFFERLMEKMVQRARTPEERERREEAAESTARVLRSPFFRGMVSAEQSLVSLRTLLLVVLGGWIVLGLLSGRWPLEYWSSVSVSSSILVLGTVVHLALKLLFTSDEAGLSLSLFLRPQDSNEALYLILSRLNAFVLWFFWIVALRVSRAYEENPLMIFTVLSLIWIATLLGSILLQVQVFITF